MTTRGLDLSSYQGKPDIGALKSRYGLDWLGIRCLRQFGQLDSSCAHNKSGAKHAGLGRVFYAFTNPSRSNPYAQADQFLALADPGDGDGLCADAEQSDLSQNETNAWLRKFGDRLRAKADGLTTIAYLGGGYATNNTGRDLADHYDYWWFPRYPSSSRTTRFPAWNPRSPAGGGTTGWKAPHLWQFTAWFAGSYDADLSTLSVAQLFHGGGTEDMDLNDKVKLNAWIPKRWPNDKGLQDGSITVETALGSGYADARKAAENTAAILAQQKAQAAVIDKLVDAVKAAQPDLDALKADIRQAIDSISVDIVTSTDTDE